MDKYSVSVIIPTFNEAQSIGEVVGKIKSLYPEFEIIVVNDGSTDHTVSVAKEAGAKVLSHPYNIGNGAAVKTGIRNASGDFIVFMDGDGQHDPVNINKLIEFIPKFDMVVGARPQGHQASFSRAVGNKIFNFFASYVTKFKIPDLTSGFRVMKRDILMKFLYLLPNTYSYPTTITMSFLRAGRSVKYVSTDTKVREKGKSNINIIRDGTRFFLIITKICALYSPFRIFLPASIVMFLTGFFYYIFTFITKSRFTNMSALLFTTSVIIFMLGLISEQISQIRFERSEEESTALYTSE